MVIVVVVVAAAAAVFDELIPRWDRREGRNTWFPMKDGEHSRGMQTTTGGTHVRRDPERIYGGNFVHLREKNARSERADGMKFRFFFLSAVSCDVWERSFIT